MLGVYAYVCMFSWVIPSYRHAKKTGKCFAQKKIIGNFFKTVFLTEIVILGVFFFLKMI